MITGIGERFHISGHLGGENQLSGTCALFAETLTHHKIVILETQDCLHRFPY
jgi:hypothetical protein